MAQVRCVVRIDVMWPQGAEHEAVASQVFNQVTHSLDYLFGVVQRCGVYEAFPLASAKGCDESGGRLTSAFVVKSCTLPTMEVDR
jgi:hypothetical protein